MNTAVLGIGRVGSLAAPRPSGVGPGKKVLPSTRTDETERLLETDTLLKIVDPSNNRYLSLRAVSPASI